MLVIVKLLKNTQFLYLLGVLIRIIVAWLKSRLTFVDYHVILSNRVNNELIIRLQLFVVWKHLFSIIFILGHRINNYKQLCDEHYHTCITSVFATSLLSLCRM